MTFAPLVVRSSHSHLFGAVSVDELVARAVELGYRHLALTDRNNLCGAPRFLQIAREAGLHPVLGAEVTEGRTAVLARTVVALAQDATGYGNLCALVSRRRRAEAGEIPDTFFSSTLPDWVKAGAPEGFFPSAEAAEGLFVLVEDIGLAEELIPVVPAGALFLRLVRPGRSETHEQQLQAASACLGLPLVATGDAAFLRPGETRLQRLLAAIGRNRTYDEVDPEDPALLPPASYLRGPAEMAQLFADLPGAVARTLELAEACAVSVPPRGRIMPRLVTPAGEVESEPREEVERLLALCREGVRWRYGFVDPAGVAPRLEAELDLIIRLGFAGYFLVVHEIVTHSRRIGAPVAGRGSGGSSLVAYLLGITNVDPLRFGIAFERFLNEGRVDAPDLDVDFCWRVRDEIIAFAFERFGRERVAMVCTHITFQARGAFREVARAFGLSDEQVTGLRKELPGRFEDLLVGKHMSYGFRRGGGESVGGRAGDIDLSEALDLAGTVSRVRPATYRKIVRAAACILGFPRHLSVHPGGIVITPGPIQAYAPVEVSAKGVMVTQYEKDGVEDMGLVKIDLLGNRALSTTREAVDITTSAEGVRLDVERLPDRDPATSQILESADTVGCNQLESPAMRHLLAQCRPTDTRGVMQCLALIRPGAASIGNKDEFVRRVRGLSAPLYADERLRAVLEDSHGILLYEDDTMLVSRALAGIDGVAADRLRKGIARARDDATRMELSERFLSACDEQGVARAAAEHTWLQMAKFNAYSFCKAHAASYATLAYAVAYMKAHHPISFWVAALNNNQGLYPKRVYVEEAKRHGIRFMLPCVHRSGLEYERQQAWQDGKDDGGRDGIRVGLSQVRSLSDRVQEEILAARPFTSLEDMLHRTSVTQPEAENLIACGACDCFGKRRPRLLLDLHLSLGAMRKERGYATLFAAGTGLPQFAVAEGAGLPVQPDWPHGEKYRREQELLEVSVREHPLAALRPFLPPSSLSGTISSRDLPEHDGEVVCVLGILDTLRRVETEAGQDMEFLTFEDEWGIYEVTMFPAAYANFARSVKGWGPYRIRGLVQDHLGSLSVTCHSIRRLELVESQSGSPRRLHDATWIGLSGSD